MPSRWSDLERPPLRSATLHRALVRAGSMWHEVQVLDEVPSTNAVVAQAAADGTGEGLVVVAEAQRAGRGRLGRAWVSPPRSGLTFSVLLRPPPAIPEARWPWLPLLTGLAVAGGVREATGADAQLKWPNDVLLDGRKVAGILVERHGSAAVVGVGLNVTTTGEELPGPQATSLVLADAPVTDRETILRVLLRALERRYRQWLADKGDPRRLAEDYTRHCATIGAAVSVQLPDGTALEGRGERVDDEGRLVVGTPAGERAVSAGDVVHVRAPGGVE